MRIFRAPFHVLVCAVVAGAGLLGSAQAQQIERPATPYRWLLDPEFNHAKGLFTWVDALTGSMWVGRVDAQGNFDPPNGQAYLIEKGAAPVGGLGFTLNGPEWAIGSTDYVVYTRFLANAEPTAANALIGVASQNADGSWTRKSLAQIRNGPYGSVNPAFPARITYQDSQGTHYWRNLADPASEEALPGLTGTGLLPAVRFVPGAPGTVVYPVTVNATPQVFAYDLTSKVFSQLTFDAGAKDQPWVWHAPELNRLALLTIVDQSRLVLYRQEFQPNGVAQWLPTVSFQSPLEGGTFFSTEPFVYQDKSYALVQILVNGYPNSIWLADFSSQQLRRLTPERPDRARADPEIYFTANGPIVFYSRFDQTKGSYWLCMPCMEGLYRVDTGLPPPKP